MFDSSAETRLASPCQGICEAPKCLLETGLFKCLNEQYIRILLHRIRPLEVQPGETIFISGDTVNSLLLIRSGLVGMSQYVAADKSQTFAICGPGRLLSIECLFDKPSPLTATALVQTLFCRLNATDVRNIAKSAPAFAFGFMQYLHEELENTYKRITAMSHYSTEKRIVSLLCELACENTGASCIVHRDVLHLGLTQTQIAELIGVTRESVCKVFASFQRRGVLEIKGPKITILDPHELFSEQYGEVTVCCQQGDCQCQDLERGAEFHYQVQQTR